MKPALFFLLYITSFTLYAQEKINDSIHKDTLINEAASETALQLLQKSDSLQITDSINKIVLEKQIQNLKSFENKKRKSLEDELAKLKATEELRLRNLEKQLTKLKSKAQGYPIVIHKDTIFTVFTNIGPISSKERAKVISDRLHELYNVYNTKKDSLIIYQNNQIAELYYNDQILLSVSELDELWFEKEKTTIINSYKKNIEEDIVVYKKDVSFLKKAKKVVLSILTIVLLSIIIKLINYLFKNKLVAIISKNQTKFLKGIKFKTYQIISPQKQYSYLILGLNIVRYLFIFIFCYLAFPVVFSIFPETQRLATVLISYVISPIKTIFHSVISFLPNLLTIIVIITITSYFLKIIKFIAKEIENEKIVIPNFFPDWAKSTYNIVKILVLAFMLIVIFPYLPGSDSTIFKGVSVFIGIIFSIGSSTVVGNLIAGLVITYMRPFKLGDRIKVGEMAGEVIEKTPFVTRLKTPKQLLVTVPNLNILVSNVINYNSSNSPEGIVIYTSVTIGYDVPWRKVHDLLIKASEDVEHVMKTPTPFVLQTSLDDFYVSYQLNFNTQKPLLEPKILSKIHQNIQDLFNENGIEILSPHYRAGRDGNMVTIPEPYLPKNYKKPSFDFKIKRD